MAIQWEQVLDALDGAVMLFDASGEVVLANQAARALLVSDNGTAALAYPWLQRCVDQVSAHRCYMYVSSPLTKAHVLQARLSPVEVEPGRAGVLLVGYVHPMHFWELPRASLEHLLMHDVQTPLSSILGFCELLLDHHLGPLNEQQRQALRHIHASAHRVRKLLSQALDALHTSETTWALNVQDVAVHALVNELLAEMDVQVRRKRQRLLTDLPEAPVWVRADPERLRQVLYNLLDNAIKYTPPHRAITLSVRVEEREVIFAVRDTGPGILPQDLAVVIMPMGRVGDAEHGLNGWGLGLYSVQTILLAHGGRFWVESRPERGSTFAFALPHAPHAAPALKVEQENVDVSRST